MALFDKADSASVLYQSLFAKSVSIMVVIDAESGIILDANEAACTFYGYSAAELCGRTIMEINTLSRDEVEKVMALARSESRNHFLFCHRLADGSLRDVEVYSNPMMLSGKKILFSIIHDVTQRLTREREREELIEKLKKARSEISALKGVLPLCSFCRKIRNEADGWETLDEYIHHNAESDITHTICPNCMKEHYPECLDS